MGKISVTSNGNYARFDQNGYVSRHETLVTS